MQPIERYGLVALVFLGITITAACLWEPDGDPTAKEPAASELAGKASAANAMRPERRDYVGARTADAQRGQPKALSAAQRQELLALQGRRGTPAPGAGQAGPGRALLGDALEQTQEAPAFEPEADPPTGQATAQAGSQAGSLPGAPRVNLPERMTKPAASSTRIYEIKSKDTLSEIAMNELGTWKRWQEIVDLNPGLDPNHLRTGARIKLPAGKTPTGGSASQAKADPDDGNGQGGAPRAKGPIHVVQQDESLWKIADLRLGKGERWGEIAALNPDIDPNRLKTGMKLVLPSDAGRTGDAAPAARTLAQAEPSEQSTRGKVR